MRLGVPCLDRPCKEMVRRSLLKTFSGRPLPICFTCSETPSKTLSFVRFNKIHLLPEAQFDDRKGAVTEERRHLIARKIVEVLRLPLQRR
jgi:hypothetical protein